MSTGIETWNMNLLDIGPMYPFPGTELVWALIGIGTWILWHVVQGHIEKKNLDEEKALFSDKDKLTHAMHVTNAETLIESMKIHGENFK